MYTCLCVKTKSYVELLKLVIHLCIHVHRRRNLLFFFQYSEKNKYVFIRIRIYIYLQNKKYSALIYELIMYSITMSIFTQFKDYFTQKYKCL
jgi:hypothetical protein